jgi:TetR/AcrR family transcriptional regulator
MQDSSTEEKILNAAIRVFQKKGMAGSRMQEIADEANINKAMLHYYFRNKQRLFEAVFEQAFSQLAPQLNLIFNSRDDIFKKIKKFASSYIDFILQNPYLPSFIIQELNNNPGFVTAFISQKDGPDPQSFFAQVEHAIKMGQIQTINPKQLLMNILSLCLFPFIAEVMVKAVMHISDKEFIALMGERKTLIPDQIIRSIKA